MWVVDWRSEWERGHNSQALFSFTHVQFTESVRKWVPKTIPRIRIPNFGTSDSGLATRKGCVKIQIALSCVLQARHHVCRFLPVQVPSTGEARWICTLPHHPCAGFCDWLQGLGGKVGWRCGLPFAGWYRSAANRMVAVL